MSKKVKRQSGEMHGFNRVARRLHGTLSGLLSNFRLSLTFRIAIHYCWQLLRTTLLVMLVVTFFLGVLQGFGIQKSLNRAAEALPDDGSSYSQLILQDASLQAELLDSEFPLAWNDQLSYAFRQAFTRLPGRLCVVARHAATGQTVLMTIALEERLIVWAWLMGALLLCDLLRMISFIRRRQKLDQRVLAPIRDITDMAATLSASNLSNRINIAGMKNELKDLATVINTMLDRIERSYNSQKQFVSDASHELRTPIAVIQGYIGMLKRWGKDDKTVLEEAIAAIDQEASGMKDLVESLLFLARHDKKTLLMEMESFDPVDVVSELHREAAMVTPEDTFLFTPADHCIIEADRGMMKQVMRILLDNAVKYTPKGGTITMGVRKEPGGCTLLMSDNGAGIPKDELPKIFERFYRSDSARKAESSGHGLGLSIARIIVIAHGGKLQVRSKVGVGTTFSISLPEKQTPSSNEEKS